MIHCFDTWSVGLRHGNQDWSADCKWRSLSVWNIANFTVKLVRGGGNWLVFDTFLRKLGQESSFCAILLLYSVMELLLVVSPIFTLTLGRDKSLPSYQWFLHVNWWVDFVYITNLPFSSLYLCIITLSNVRFMFRIIIDQVPILYLFLVSGAPTFVSRHHLLFILASVVPSDTIWGFLYIW